MHDTHLIEKIYESISELCRVNSIVKVNALDLEVDKGSHINAPLLLEHLCERENSMFGNWTHVHIDYKPFEKLTAVIISIDGESSDSVKHSNETYN
ncbi:MAG: hypothetical protein CVU91_12305 [Firmicutes bacterium HGW-Firmicutes-16]|nr:MAG: hypothetical protein CVU91_12305 [Firmicutes bacterium HGW-Firmicutes-16]